MTKGILVANMSLFVKTIYARKIRDIHDKQGRIREAAIILSKTYYTACFVLILPELLKATSITQRNNKR